MIAVVGFTVGALTGIAIGYVLGVHTVWAHDESAKRTAREEAVARIRGGREPRYWS